MVLCHTLAGPQQETHQGLMMPLGFGLNYDPCHCDAIRDPCCVARHLRLLPMMSRWMSMLVTVDSTSTVDPCHHPAMIFTMPSLVVPTYISISSAPCHDPCHAMPRIITCATCWCSPRFLLSTAPQTLTLTLTPAASSWSNNYKFLTLTLAIVVSPWQGLSRPLTETLR